MEWWYKITDHRHTNRPNLLKDVPTKLKANSNASYVNEADWLDNLVTFWAIIVALCVIESNHGLIVEVRWPLMGHLQVFF